MCVCFSFLISILYVNVGNALIKTKRWMTSILVTGRLYSPVAVFSLTLCTHPSDSGYTLSIRPTAHFPRTLLLLATVTASSTCTLGFSTCHYKCVCVFFFLNFYFVCKRKKMLSLKNNFKKNQLLQIKIRLYTWFQLFKYIKCVELSIRENSS